MYLILVKIAGRKLVIDSTVGILRFWRVPIFLDKNIISCWPKSCAWVPSGTRDMNDFVDSNLFGKPSVVVFVSYFEALEAGKCALKLSNSIRIRMA